MEYIWYYILYVILYLFNIFIFILLLNLTEKLNLQINNFKICRSILEYAASVWDPVENQTLTNKIEMVQRKAVRNNKWQQLSSPTEI